MLGARRGVDGIDENTMRQMHFRRNYIIKDDGIYKKCKKCAQVLLVDKNNFYFTKKGHLKYSLCKRCYVRRVTIERMIREEIKKNPEKRWNTEDPLK